MNAPARPAPPFLTPDQLADHLCAYCAAEGLPPMSADELIHEDITPEQRRWLSAFIILWEDNDKRPEDPRTWALPAKAKEPGWYLPYDEMTAHGELGPFPTKSETDGVSFDMVDRYPHFEPGEPFEVRA